MHKAIWWAAATVAAKYTSQDNWGITIVLKMQAVQPWAPLIESMQGKNSEEPTMKIFQKSCTNPELTFVLATTHFLIPS